MTPDEFIAQWSDSSDKVLVHTSGSTGTPKPMWVSKQKMRESARITCDFLGIERGDRAFLCLPADYIAGKMMIVRAQTRGLVLDSVEPSGHPLSGLDIPPGSDNWTDLAAMVPLQVHNSLSVPAERSLLYRIRHLIIGGGAIDPSLEEAVSMMPNAVWSTYGMTETLSHIALRRLNGPAASKWYTPFDGVSVRTNADGCLEIDAPAVAEGTVRTNDIAEMSADGRHFSILGRKDNVICSGGLKIQIEEVEKALSRHLHKPYVVSKRKDPLLGEATVLITEDSDLSTVRDTCERVLPRHHRPRHYMTAKIPMTETGKPARAEAARMAAVQYHTVPR